MQFTENDFLELELSEVLLDLSSEILKLEQGVPVRGFLIGTQKIDAYPNYPPMLKLAILENELPVVKLVGASAMIMRALESIPNFTIEDTYGRPIAVEFVLRGERMSKTNQLYKDISVRLLNFKNNNLQISNTSENLLLDTNEVSNS